jgi:hypothetical protein
MLFVRFAVDRSRRLLLGPGVVDDPGGRLIVTVRRVLYQFLLAELKTLRLAASGFLHRHALFAPAL